MNTDAHRPSDRPGSVRYLSQVARAAEDTGFEAALTPVGAGCPDPWTVCRAAGRGGARQEDVARRWGDPRAAGDERVARWRARAAAQGSEIRLGIRLHGIARDAAAAAWAEAERLRTGMDPARIEAAQRRFAR